MKHLKSFLKKMVQQIEQHAPYASAFASEVKGYGASVSSFDKQASFANPIAGVTLTAFTGKHFIEKSVSGFTEEDIEKACNELINDCQTTGIDKKTSLTIDAGEEIEKDYKIEMKKDASKLELDKLLTIGKTELEEIKSLSTKIVNAGLNYGFNQTNELFVNRSKTLYQEINRWTSIFWAVFADGDKQAQIWGGDSKHGGYEHIEIPEEKIKKAIADGEKILYAKRLKPGTYDCIFSPEMSGMFAHEAFGHGTETDMYLKNRAKGKEFMNKQVAAKMVNMFDSPALEGASGSYFFDHEGNLAKQTQIIKDGILVSGLTDTNSAIRLGYKQTPNSRRENYAHKVYARMTNTFFGTGNDELEDMIASIKHGFLVDYPSNGMEDPKGWGIQLEGIYAREIIDGKLTDNYYSPIIVTGYVPDLLNSITMMGKKIEIAGLGSCGKGYKEWVKVTDGGPYIKLKARLA